MRNRFWSDTTTYETAAESDGSYAVEYGFTHYSDGTPRPGLNLDNAPTMATAYVVAAAGLARLHPYRESRLRVVFDNLAARVMTGRGFFERPSLVNRKLLPLVARPAGVVRVRISTLHHAPGGEWFGEWSTGPVIHDAIGPICEVSCQIDRWARNLTMTEQPHADQAKTANARNQRRARS
ncbi:hypothetical protein [Nocardia sp. CNY236]|uniref:hypothetical protein n=1 Tax=Nocardia sp. CNY236 TaxID=1169152 RepID=UPI000426E135|nr:hypothetical protein [Nocardia sp. CNY236]